VFLLPRVSPFEKLTPYRVIHQHELCFELMRAAQAKLFSSLLPQLFSQLLASDARMITIKASPH
jgi:hypothetical protein